MDKKWKVKVGKGNRTYVERVEIMYDFDNVYQYTAQWLLLYQGFKMQPSYAIVYLYVTEIEFLVAWLSVNTFLTMWP